MEFIVHDIPLPIEAVPKSPRPCSPSTPVPEPMPEDDFYPAWDRFLARSAAPATDNSALAKRVAGTVDAASKDDNGLNVHESSRSSYDVAAAECRAKVRAIVAECRCLNQKYIDRHFDLEINQNDCLCPLGNSSYDEDSATPSAVKRVEDIFENPQFNEDRACASDVIQGQLGDCWLLAALMSVAAKPGLIKRLCVDRDEQVGVYGFVFFRDGGWVPEVVDDRLFLHVSDGEDLFIGRFVDTSSIRTQEVSTTSYDMNKLRENLQKGGEALFFARCKGSSDTWLPLIEKAYAKIHGDYGSMDGGDTSEGIEDLTGGISVSLKPSQILDKQVFWEEIKNANDTYLFAGGATHYERGGKCAHHAYAVLQVAEYKDLKLLKLRDPWGKHQDEGPWMHRFTEWSSELVDTLGDDFKDTGAFWMTYEKFLRHFYVIDRTRLLMDGWKMTQQWASFDVPHIAAYLDTQFSLEIPESGPVVVVLCQPDTRYFRGLEGRYEFSLHFRIYSRSTESSDSTSPTLTFLTRSMHGSGFSHRGLRSVTSDIDLPAGTYSVQVKVTPQRLTHRVCAGQLVEEHQQRQEKLLKAGQNFDIAHAKGRRREKEVANRRRKREQIKQKKMERQAKARKVRQEAKRRKLKRKARIEEERTKRKESMFWKEVHEKATMKGIPIPPDVPRMPDVNGTAIALAAVDLNADTNIVDDDFEWDPEIDGSVSSDPASEDWEKDLYPNDPWNAICVLGLRVYSRNCEATIKVSEAEQVGPRNGVTIPEEEQGQARQGTQSEGKGD